MANPRTPMCVHRGIGEAKGKISGQLGIATLERHHQLVPPGAMRTAGK